MKNHNLRCSSKCVAWQGFVVYFLLIVWLTTGVSLAQYQINISQSATAKVALFSVGISAQYHHVPVTNQSTLYISSMDPTGEYYYYNITNDGKTAIQMTCSVENDTTLSEDQYFMELYNGTEWEAIENHVFIMAYNSMAIVRICIGPNGSLTGHTNHEVFTISFVAKQWD
ncbi:MAG TPA: hypothetical protein DER23_00785 [Clostridiales bacterium]|mgnify:FL=1|jgi:hypothetical protein|nr:hypothetical protein [Clostridiales bacterium]HCG34856.1 hypothetical protein [Clostridiales bacterium]